MAGTRTTVSPVRGLTNGSAFRRLTLCALIVFVVADLVCGALPGAARVAAVVGAPIKVATIGDFQASGVDNRQWEDAVRARFNFDNARGGLSDAEHTRHKVVLIACNSASDPDQTTRCAQEAIDERVVAVVGMSAVYGDNALSLLAAAGIAVIGVRVNTPADETSPASFPIASSFTAELMAMPQLLARQGAKKIAVIISDYGAATDDVLRSLQRGLSRTDADAGPIVRVAPGTTAFATAVTAAAQPGVDGIVGFVAGGPAGALARQLQASGFTGKYVTRAPWGNAPAASDPDTAIDGTLVVGQFAPSTSNVPGWKQFRRDLHVDDPNSISYDEGAINYWLAARVFEHLALSVDVTHFSRAVLDPLFDVAVDIGGTGGLTPPLMATDTTSELPRLFNQTVTFNTTSNGAVRLLTRQFFDPFTGRWVP
jgi:ABC-type branched-subunit amino acid transport system substrate-binding protein